MSLTLQACKRKKSFTSQWIYRHSDEKHFLFPTPAPRQPPTYPWENCQCHGLPRITKEFFACKGDSLHPTRKITRRGREYFFYDCASHGLPMKDDKEFIYPTLLNLLNAIQDQTGKRVVITTGHRCPQHNQYADPSPYHYGSKHMMGAEVDFYVEGLETSPLEIIALVQKQYENDPKYREFERFDAAKLDVSTPAWHNGEIFMKLYLADEGRDFDNQHPYPYISIQIQRDRETGERVRFDETAAQNFLRY